MYARGGGAQAAAACEEGAWPLALAPGQNQFTVMVTAPEAAAQACWPAPVLCIVLLCGGTGVLESMDEVKAHSGVQQSRGNHGCPSLGLPSVGWQAPLSSVQGFVASQLSRAAAPGPAPGGAPGQAPIPGAGSIRNPAVAAAAAVGGAARPALAAAAVLAIDGAAARLAPDLAPSLGPSAAFGPAADAQRLAAAVLRAATDTYSLSVVRLADPEHATVAEVGPAICSAHGWI